MSHAIIFSDVHIYGYKEFANYDTGINSRILDGIDVLKQIMEVGRRYEDPIFIHNGDLFYERGKIETEASNLVRSLFCTGEYEAETKILNEGNHDKNGGTEYHNANANLQSEFNTIVHDIHMTKIRSKKGTYDLCFIGYKDTLKEFMEAFERINGMCRPEKTFLFIHQDMIGGSMGGFTMKKGVDPKIFKDYLHVFNGHIHDPQKVEENVTIIGSPMHHNFGDKGKRGILVLNFETLKVEFVPIKFKEFLDITDKSQAKGDHYFRYVGEKPISADGKNIKFVKKLAIPENKEVKEVASDIDMITQYAGKNKGFVKIGLDLFKEANNGSI